MIEDPPSWPPGLPDNSRERLDSWKEIAAYLKRGVTTVQRWEQHEGLPVHRHFHDKRGSVYALKSELDAWWREDRRWASALPDEPRHYHSPWWSRGAIVIILIFVGTLTVGFWGWSRTTGSFLRSGASPTAQMVLAERLQNGPGAAIAVSPDQSFVVYVGWREGEDYLFRRSTKGLAGVQMKNTAHARAPFFSPDGQWIGFFADSQLKRVSIEGGEAITICSAAGVPGGAVWGSNGGIVFALLGSGLQRVSWTGGTPQPVTDPRAHPGEMDHRWPELLPGDSGVVLFTAWSGSLETATLIMQSLDTGERRRLGAGSNARFARPTHLMFARADGLWAIRFDPTRRSPVGSAVRVLETVRPRQGGAADYALSQDGRLVYVPDGSDQNNAIIWVDAAGTITPITDAHQLYFSPRISPDGQRIALVARSSEGGLDIWIHDIARSTRTRIAAHGSSFNPVWTPDGKEITFASISTGPSQVYLTTKLGTGEPVPLVRAEFAAYPSSWSADGRFLALQTLNTSSGHDVWVLTRSGTQTPVRVSPFNETTPALSPDGRFIAYASSESGLDQVYVEAYPRQGERSRISTGGGEEPIWSRDGKALYYRSAEGNQLFRVTVTLHPAFSASKPTLMLEGQYVGRSFAGGGPNYDVAPDGKRFLLVRHAGDSVPQHIVLIGDWQDRLMRAFTQHSEPSSSTGPL